MTAENNAAGPHPRYHTSHATIPEEPLAPTVPEHLGPSHASTVSPFAQHQPLPEVHENAQSAGNYATPAASAVLSGNYAAASGSGVMGEGTMSANTYMTAADSGAAPGRYEDGDEVELAHERLTLLQVRAVYTLLCSSSRGDHCHSRMSAILLLR